MSPFVYDHLEIRKRIRDNEETCLKTGSATVVEARHHCLRMDGSNARMYPKPFGGNPERFQENWAAVKAERDVTFVGRLAISKYLDMDDVVA